MKVITAPERVNFEGKISIFLAGSIEMGEATEWQKEAIEMLEARIPKENHHLYQILNPRRPDWDSNWKQEYENPQFYQQVTWERKGLKGANIVLIILDPATKSPVSLIELGEFHKKGVVVCPEGFWKKGNVDILCEDEDVPQRATLEEAIDLIIEQSKCAWE